MICPACGTLDGSIFIFEECDTAPIRIDRALLYLEQVGKLEGVRGIVVGELAGCEWYERGAAEGRLLSAQPKAPELQRPVFAGAHGRDQWARAQNQDGR